MSAGPDCERRRARFPSEPANTLSSLAFLPGAVLVARRGDRFVAAALAANGLGSAWYHARYGRASRWGHDWAIAALLWLLTTAALDPGGRRRLDAAGLAATAAAHAALPDAGPVVHAVVGTTSTVATVWAARRHGLARRRAALVAGALVTGAACYLAGRPRSRWCRPDSLLQPHAAWHVLAAVASTGVALEAGRR